MRMKVKDPTPQHKAFRDDLIAVLRKYPDMQADEILAISSYFVGQIIALQDQRKMTPEKAMKIVASNIEAGNQHTMKEVLSAGGTAN